MAHNESESVQMVRRARDKFYRETRGLDAEGVLEYIRKGAEKYKTRSEKYLASQPSDKRNAYAKEILERRVENTEPDAVKEVRQWRDKSHSETQALGLGEKRQYFRKQAAASETRVEGLRKTPRRSNKTMSK